MTRSTSHNRPTARPLRVGFVPLCDCAPIVMAHELGLFSRHGLEVELSREVGWATIRDKIVYRELDAAQATAPLLFAASLGLGCPRTECLTGLVLNLQGNAITLSNRLWASGVRDGATLLEFVRSKPAEPPLTLGVVSRFSAHNFLLRKWLRTQGIDAERQAQIVVLPPPQMPPSLKTGNLDGYCVGEPWNSEAVAKQTGWIAATSAGIEPLHPEKVLMVRREFAESRADEHTRLLGALYQACAFCDHAENRERVARTLARPGYVNAPAAVLRASLTGPLDLGWGRQETNPEFHIFARHDANDPSPARAAWVLENLPASGAVPAGTVIAPELGDKVFRRDLFLKARPNPPSA